MIILENNWHKNCLICDRK
ncbi:hypothetical protein [Streptococcus cuniculi]